MGWWETAAFEQATWIFLRLFGVVSVIAFLSLLAQLRGLFFSTGILPIAEYMEEVRRRGVRWTRVPSLFWLGTSDRAIGGVAVLGAVASAAVTLDVVTVPALGVVWVCYLSFTTTGRDFLAFQWDVMLVEVTLVALLLAVQSPPHPIALLLAWFFAFRFMFSSGIAKLLSGDRTWRELTALAYHYETQPLPTRTAWHAQRLGSGVHRATTLAVLVIEIAVPFLLFGPEPVRLAAVVALVVLQVGIVATGNYGFFNLLAVVILVPFVPDRIWSGVAGEAGAASVARPEVVRWVVGALALVLLLLNLARLAELVSRRQRLRRLLRAFAPWRIANRYGLFAVMTKTRPEIIVEGSADGESWRAYEFRWKPGDPTRAPGWNAPHQPRLDWQMWFAALGDRWSNPWFSAFLQRLLEGSMPVRRLLAYDPFPDEPPRYIRARLTMYAYTDRRTRGETGRWWDVVDAGIYTPPARLHDGGIVFER
jgi:lipase maturation factor 1